MKGQGLRPFARTLRSNQTEAEKKLWLFLRARQLTGYKFRRQQPIGPYIVDFCCLERKLVIELDGSQHIKNQVEDKLRTKFLNQEGFQILRFWDNEVLRNIDGVLEQILKQMTQSPSPSPLPSRERKVSAQSFFVFISSFILLISSFRIAYADPGAHPDFGGIQKKISIQRGTAISVWLDRGDVAKSSAMTPVGDGTWEFFTDLSPGATYNFMFFAVTGSTAPTGLSPNSIYNDTPPTDFTGTIRFPTSTSSTTITGSQTASFGKAGSGDDRRVVFVPSGNTTFYVFANFAHTPNPPQNIFAQPVDTGTIRLMWNYPKDNWNSTLLADVVAGGKYFIYFSTTGSAGPFTLIASTQGSATEFTHNNLNGNLTYFYVITSSDAYRGATQTGKVDQVGIDDNFVMAFPDFAQASGRPRGATPTYFRVDSIDWEKIGGDNALVYLTPWDEDARFYEQKIKGRIVQVYLP